jgi:hypothetical protein
MILLGVNLVDLTSIATQSNYEWNEKGKKKNTQPESSFDATWRDMFEKVRESPNFPFPLPLLCSEFVLLSSDRYFFVLSTQLITVVSQIRLWWKLYIYVLFNFKFINHFQLSYLQNISVLLLISCLICYFIIVTPVLFK